MNFKRAAKISFRRVVYLYWLLLFSVTGLALGTAYEFTVMAFNDIGDSDYQPAGIVAMTSSKQT